MIKLPMRDSLDNFHNGGDACEIGQKLEESAGFPDLKMGWIMKCFQGSGMSELRLANFSQCLALTGLNYVLSRLTYIDLCHTCLHYRYIRIIKAICALFVVNYF